VETAALVGEAAAAAAEEEEGEAAAAAKGKRTALGAGPWRDPQPCSSLGSPHHLCVGTGSADSPGPCGASASSSPSLPPPLSFPQWRGTGRPPKSSSRGGGGEHRAWPGLRGVGGRGGPLPPDPPSAVRAGGGEAEVVLGSRGLDNDDLGAGMSRGETEGDSVWVGG
jgi:hypothetical protein